MHECRLIEGRVCGILGMVYRQSKKELPNIAASVIVIGGMALFDIIFAPFSSIAVIVDVSKFLN